MEISILRPISEDLFITVTSIMAESDVLSFLEEDPRGGARKGAPFRIPLAAVICKKITSSFVPN